jgi:hypothetical protein
LKKKTAEGSDRAQRAAAKKAELEQQQKEEEQSKLERQV